MTSVLNTCIAISIAICLLIQTATSKVTKEEDCEVCVKFLTRFAESLTSDERSNPATVEKKFRETCKTVKKREERFCYYIGGLETSATGMLGEMSKPISWGMPALKVCEKLEKKDAQICDLKYEKQIDLTNVNLKKLKVKDLRKILSDWDESCKGCAEKSDFVRRIEELMPIHAPAAAQARTEL